jgi:hypothetical protein
VEEVQIRGHGGRIVISVMGYEFPDLSNTCDDNWLKCFVLVEVNAFKENMFKGEVNLFAETHDFVRFLDQLQSAYYSVHGEAHFTPIEQEVEFVVKVSSRMSRVTGILKVMGSETMLNFSFATDQSYFPEALAGLRAIVEAFPVRE